MRPPTRQPKKQGWRASGQGPEAPTPAHLRVLTAAVKNEIRAQAKNTWSENWRTGTTRRTTYQLAKQSTKETLKEFKQMTRPESSVIVQARTGKIGLRDYLYKIGAEPSPACPCGFRRQTVKHTLLECPGFAELREEMWVGGKRETDLTRLLGTPALAARVLKFFLATGELL